MPVANDTKTEPIIHILFVFEGQWMQNH